MLQEMMMSEEAHADSPVPIDDLMTRDDDEIVHCIYWPDLLAVIQSPDYPIPSFWESRWTEYKK